MNGIRIYRFGDEVAFNLGDDISRTPGNFYLDAGTAREFARALLVYAGDIDTRKFTESSLGTVEIGRDS